jgi:hypothetical protein
MVPCHACDSRKRPLATCPSCHAPADVEADLSAWRLALHASHLSRITADPDAPVVDERPSLAPLRVVMVETDEGPLDPVIAAAEPLFEQDGPRSFDWDEPRGLRLRRSA